MVKQFKYIDADLTFSDNSSVYHFVGKKCDYSRQEKIGRYHISQDISFNGKKIYLKTPWVIKKKKIHNREGFNKLK